MKLTEALVKKDITELERNGMIQRFEFSIELVWKTLKDFLEYKGFSFKPSPNDTLRLAQESEYVDYAQTLIDGLAYRNMLSHVYDEKLFEEAELEIRNNIFPALNKLYRFFANEKAMQCLD